MEANTQAPGTSEQSTAGAAGAASAFVAVWSGTQERILELLGAGASQSQVAMAVGVEESYISQLMAQEEFRKAVQELRAEAAAKHAAVDARIDSIEDKAWRRIDNLVELETNLMKLLKVAQAANAAKRRTQGVGMAQPATALTVNIALPQAAVVEFTMSTDRQVVDIGGRAMTTMPSKLVQERLKERKAERLAEDVTPQVSGPSAKLLSQF